MKVASWEVKHVHSIFIKTRVKFVEHRCLYIATVHRTGYARIPQVVLVSSTGDQLDRVKYNWKPIYFKAE